MFTIQSGSCVCDERTNNKDNSHHKIVMYLQHAQKCDKISNLTKVAAKTFRTIKMWIMGIFIVVYRRHRCAQVRNAWYAMPTLMRRLQTIRSLNIWREIKFVFAQTMMDGLFRFSLRAFNMKSIVHFVCTVAYTRYNVIIVSFASQSNHSRHSHSNRYSETTFSLTNIYCSFNAQSNSSDTN